MSVCVLLSCWRCNISWSSSYRLVSWEQFRWWKCLLSAGTWHGGWRRWLPGCRTSAKYNYWRLQLTEIDSLHRRPKEIVYICPFIFLCLSVFPSFSRSLSLPQPSSQAFVWQLEITGRTETPRANERGCNADHIRLINRLRTQMERSDVKRQDKKKPTRLEKKETVTHWFTSAGNGL